MFGRRKRGSPQLGRRQVLTPEKSMTGLKGMILTLEERNALKTAFPKGKMKPVIGGFTVGGVDVPPKPLSRIHLAPKPLLSRFRTREALLEHAERELINVRRLSVVESDFANETYRTEIKNLTKLIEALKKGSKHK